jgi:hypothetical protein
MEKILITNKDEIFDIIVNCYQTDKDLINKYHVISGSGLSACVDKTASDLILNNISVYKLIKDNKFVGYFGELNNNLTGFFIIPTMRTIEIKNLFWKTITEHFKDGFTVGIFLKNKRAIKFLKKNGCVSIGFENSENGIGEIMQYNKVGV